jgi:ParB/RepB/Spo0J family partition protein
MNEPTPTRQQRDILDNLNKTLGSFTTQSPYPDGSAPTPPAGRRKNPRALIVAASRIHIDPDQVRQKERDAASPRIQELARSIEKVGLQHPIGVREAADGSYSIVYGEGRFIAMTEVLHWQEVEVLRVDAKNEDLLWHQLHENIHRTSLDPLDLSAAIAQARDNGYSLAQIAQQMGKSETWVQRCLTIGTRIGEEAKAILQSSDQRPAVDAVYAIAQAPTESQADLARQLTEQGLTRRETEALAAAAGKGQRSDAKPRRTGRPKKSRPFETTLRATNGATVTVKFRKAHAEAEEIATALEDVLRILRSQAAA